jgi:uncharacterized membrane protein
MKRKTKAKTRDRKEKKHAGKNKSKLTGGTKQRAWLKRVIKEVKKNARGSKVTRIFCCFAASLFVCSLLVVVVVVSFFCRCWRFAIVVVVEEMT